MHSPIPSPSASKCVRMGRKAASVLPAAVAAAISTSWSHTSSAGIARSWASRMAFQFSAHIQRWIRPSSSANEDDCACVMALAPDSKLEGGQFRILLGLDVAVAGAAMIGAHLDGTQQLLPGG